MEASVIHRVPKVCIYIYNIYTHKYLYMVTQGLLYYLAKHQELNQIIERECKIEKHMFRFKNSLKTSNSTNCKRVQNSKGQVENSKLIWHSIRLCFSKLSPIELTHSNHSWNFIQLCLGPRDEISLEICFVVRFSVVVYPSCCFPAFFR